MSSALPIESQSAPRSPRESRLAALRAVPVRAVAIVVALGLAGFAIGYLGSWPPFATVMSGSMSPTIKTGDVVVLKRLDGLPRVGDVVKVSVPDAARTRYGYPPEVVHRVVRVTPGGEITTKGDAKPRPDPFSVGRDAVSARVVTHIPAAGRVVAFLMSPMGLLWIAAGVVMFFVLPLIERRQEAEQAEHDALAAMQAELHAISDELARLRVEPVQSWTAPAEERGMHPEPAVNAMPATDWLELETMPEPPAAPEPALFAPWPEPPAFLPGYQPIGREREPAAVESWLEAEPAAAFAVPAVSAVRRRSGGLLGRIL